MERKKYEYETVKILPELYFNKLNELGLQGWDFCFMIVLQEVHKSIITNQQEVRQIFYATLKREKI
jgi:hypothetical protein